MPQAGGLIFPCGPASGGTEHRAEGGRTEAGDDLSGEFTAIDGSGGIHGRRGLCGAGRFSRRSQPKGANCRSERDSNLFRPAKARGLRGVPGTFSRPATKAPVPALGVGKVERCSRIR